MKKQQFRLADTNRLFEALRADFRQRGEQIADEQIAEMTFGIAKRLITPAQLQLGRRLLQQHSDANSAGHVVDDEEALQILVEPDDITPQFADIRRQVLGRPA